jgi:alpha-beta hydrolase superfamily lysophospholipase
VVRAALVLSVVAVLVLALLWGFQRHLIYLPSRGPVPAADSSIAGARDVVLRTSDGLDLGAWLVPASAPDRDVVVLVAAGNAGNRAGRAPLARALSSRGLAVLLFDYRGYGDNPGSPSEAGLARDVRAARSFLVDEAGWSPDQVVYFGESLGAAVVTELAVEHPPAGLVLRSPFVDLTSVGRVHDPFLPVGTLLRDRFPLVEHLASVNAPVAVVYGGRDTVVPAEQSRAVAAAAPDLAELVELPRADHNDRALLDGRRLVDAVVDLAERVS